MSMLKVTIYQKSLEEGLTDATIKKLAALKSDFLVLPEHFSGTVLSPPPVVEGEVPVRPALDWLLRLSDVYRGVIVGGAMLIGEGSESFVACPILSGGNVIDWYRKRRIGPKDKKASPGKDPGVFILAGHRFGTLLGHDLLDRSLLVELADMGIRIIFAPLAFGADEGWDSAPLEAAARELGLYVACCSGAGSLTGGRVLGRSLMITPDGVSWRVSDQESGNEIVKTVMFGLKG